MKILVCGGRDFGNVVRTKPLTEDEPPETQKRLKEYRFIFDTLDKIGFEENWPRTLEDEYGNWLYNVTIISGAAKGVDSVAIDWAIVGWTNWKEYPADWKKYGKKAGPIRNKQMLEEGKPDLVVAFPGGTGTAHMVRIAKQAGVKVIEVKYNE